MTIQEREELQKFTHIHHVSSMQNPSCRLSIKKISNYTLKILPSTSAHW
jgi:hypothetical protein